MNSECSITLPFSGLYNTTLSFHEPYGVQPPPAAAHTQLLGKGSSQKVMKGYSSFDTRVSSKVKPIILLYSSISQITNLTQGVLQSR